MSQQETTLWDLDVGHSTLSFKIKHLMISNVRGSFTTFSGTLKLDAHDPTHSVVDVSIAVKSIDTAQAKRDEDLRGPLFFDVEKYPNLTFKSARIDKDGQGYKVHGAMCIRDVTRDVVLHVEGLSAPAKDMQGRTRMGTSATTKINRTDFGLSWNKTLEAGGVIVGEDVAIEIDAEFVLNK